MRTNVARRTELAWQTGRRRRIAKRVAFDLLVAITVAWVVFATVAAFAFAF